MRKTLAEVERFKDFRLYLLLEFSSRRQRNENYSLRSFARTLAVSPSSLSAMFSGKRPIGDKMRERLGLKLGLNPRDLIAFDTRPHGNRRILNSDTSSPQDYQSISADVFQVIAEPHHYALLELIKTQGFRWDIKWISKRLNLSASDVRSAIERLKIVGLLELSPDGVLTDTTNGFSTDIREGLSLEAQRRFQQASLRKAEAAIDETPAHLRDNTSITFALNTRDIVKAKAMIKAFRRKLCRELESALDLNEVYQMTIAFTPLSNVTEDVTKE